MAVTVLVSLVLLTACSGGGPVVSGTNVDVDTPELRSLKAEVGIDECEPGPGGGGLPDLTLPCLGGGPDINLADLRGPMIVNIWFSGCGPCLEEMPALQAFSADHGEQVAMLGIDVEIYPKAALDFTKLVGATYPQIADPGGEILDLPDLRVPGFPQVLFIDEGGVLTHQMGLGIDTKADVVALAEEHLGVAL